MVRDEPVITVHPANTDCPPWLPPSPPFCEFVCASSKHRLFSNSCPYHLRSVDSCLQKQSTWTILQHGCPHHLRSVILCLQKQSGDDQVELEEPELPELEEPDIVPDHDAFTTSAQPPASGGPPPEEAALPSGRPLRPCASDDWGESVKTQAAAARGAEGGRPERERADEAVKQGAVSGLYVGDPGGATLTWLLGGGGGPQPAPPAVGTSVPPAVVSSGDISSPAEHADDREPASGPAAAAAAAAQMKETEGGLQRVVYKRSKVVHDFVFPVEVPGIAGVRQRKM